MSAGFWLSAVLVVLSWVVAIANLVFFFTDGHFYSLAAFVACVVLSACSTYLTVDTWRLERRR